MTIGILTAMSVEYQQVVRMLTETEEKDFGPIHYTTGKLGNNSIVLQQCGIGKVNAAMGVTDLILHFQPHCIISTGVAGGIDSRLRVMDVVAGSTVCHHDVWCGEGCDPGQVQGLPTHFTGDAEMLQKATSIESDVRILEGLICTGDQFITAKDELQKIKSAHPEGLAVDMESAAIAQVCHLHQIPFLSFRIISDTPGVENHFEQYLDFWGTMADKSFNVTKRFLESL